MAYRLALDVGTASCGLVVWTLDENGTPYQHAYDSLDIWQEPLLPAKSGGVGEPKKAARRAARMMRRGITRRARRLRRISHQAALIGLTRHEILPDKGQNIHRLRALAAGERIELAQLLPVLLHLAKSRGPSGDWVYEEPKLEGKKRGKKPAESDTAASEASATIGTNEEKKSIVGGVRKLEQLIAEAAHLQGKEDLTLGQYLYHRQQKSEAVILGKPEIGLYPSRRRVEREFHQIWDTQAQFHSVLTNAEIKKEFFEAIFHQRPLKSPAPMVGHCDLEPTLPRAPAAQMAAQAFRIEKQIADLRWGMGRNQLPLSKEQKLVVRNLLNTSGEVKFKALLEALEESGCPAPGGRGLNMDRSSRESLKGNTTQATFQKLGLSAEWAALDEKTQIQAINFLADLGSPDALDSEDWHQNFSIVAKDGKPRRREFTPELISFINKLRSLGDKFKRLSSMGFDGGRMSYSIKALKKFTSLMQEGWDERAAIDQAYPDHNKPKPLAKELGLPEETGNTVVDVALRQVYRAVDRAIKAMKAPPVQVIVELSRDMALGLKKRGEIETKINVNNKARREAAKAIEAHGEVASERNLQRYLLWESQSHYCPYCDKRIDMGEALSSETEREHILPRTLTRVGGKRSQLVLAHRVCNQQKGNRTPWQAFGDDESRWRTIEERAAQLSKNKQWSKARLLLLKDWDNEVLDNEAIQGFTDRQFHESSWIAKATAQWLRTVCPDVSVSRGELTAHLRRIWKLDTVIPQVRYESGLPVLDVEGRKISQEDFEKHRGWWEGHHKHEGAVPTDRKPDKRIDHRHHLIDALVISLTDRGLFNRMASNYKLEREKEKRGERARFSLYEQPPIPLIRDLALQIVRDAEIRHKPDHHPDGALFEQTAYGRSRKPNKDGKHLLAVSKSLKSLIDPKFSAEKTRNTLERIESTATQEVILKEFDRRVAAGIAIKKIFDEPILHPQYGTQIRRVRLLGNSVETAATITHINRKGQQLHKLYAHDGNAYLEIRIEDGKLADKPRLVNIQQAMQEKGSRPSHGVRRFWKGDTVSDLRDNRRYLVRQIKTAGGGKLIISLSSEAREVRDMNLAGGLKEVAGNSLFNLQPI